MPARSSAESGDGMAWETIEFWFYRVGGYVLLNLLDEPAWLALMFC